MNQDNRIKKNEIYRYNLSITNYNKINYNLTQMPGRMASSIIQIF
jgi:hypothetical protein